MALDLAYCAQLSSSRTLEAVQARSNLRAVLLILKPWDRNPERARILGVTPAAALSLCIPRVEAVSEGDRRAVNATRESATTFSSFG